MTDLPVANRFVSVGGFSRRVKSYAMPLVEYFAKLVNKGLYEDGTEAPSEVPMQPPLGYIKQPTMVDHIRRMVQSENLRVAALEAGVETFEEADDFDVEDDVEPVSAYEFDEVFDPPVVHTTVVPKPAASGPDASGPAVVPPVPEPSAAPPPAALP